MMHEAASFPDKGNSVEAGADARSDARRPMEGVQRPERRMARGNSGCIIATPMELVKEGEDPISAWRYAMMMLRYGRTDAERARRRCLAAGARPA
jgi:hypothetical protein